MVVEGTGRVTVGEETFDVEMGSSIFIPNETIHRLENNSNNPLLVVETQMGTYFGEDDIIRFEDEYGRQTE